MNETSAALRTAALDVMAIDDVTEGVASPYVVFLGDPPPRPDEPSQGVRLRGRLLLPPDEAYGRLTQRSQAKLRADARGITHREAKDWSGTHRRFNFASSLASASSSAADIGSSGGKTWGEQRPR